MAEHPPATLLAPPLAREKVSLALMVKLDWHHDRVEIIPNEQGNRTTPSYVAFTYNERLIGDAALNQVAMNPANTVRIHENADDDLVMSIIDFTYPDILDNINDPSYFQEKAILAPMNEVADTINEKLLEKSPEMVYLSCDR
ncbi:heat shock protein family A member 8 [Tanacetum coccineum]